MRLTMTAGDGWKLQVTHPNIEVNERGAWHLAARRALLDAYNHIGAKFGPGTVAFCAEYDRDGQPVPFPACGELAVFGDRSEWAAEWSERVAKAYRAWRIAGNSEGPRAESVAAFNARHARVVRLKARYELALMDGRRGV